MIALIPAVGNIIGSTSNPSSGVGWRRMAERVGPHDHPRRRALPRGLACVGVPEVRYGAGMTDQTQVRHYRSADTPTRYREGVATSHNSRWVSVAPHGENHLLIANYLQLLLLDTSSGDLCVVSPLFSPELGGRDYSGIRPAFIYRRVRCGSRTTRATTYCMESLMVGPVL